MQYIPTTLTGKTSDKKHYSYGECPLCGTAAKHEKIDDYIVCMFCNKQFDRQSLIKTGSPNPPKCPSYSARFQKKKR